MEIKTVRADDVYEDEANPRSDFGDLKALAESFALNKMRPGQPVNPPVVVRDGGIYRIVDGARRFRAMQMLGTREFSAIVCDDYDDADSILAMLATDDKKQLTPVEQSRGVQRAILLGVAPQKVEAAAKRKGAKRIKRAMEIAGVEAETMSIDHLLAVEEFADDEKRRDLLMSATESNWKDVLERCRKEAKNEKVLASLVDKARELGIQVMEGGAPSGYSYKAVARTAEDLERLSGPDGLAATTSGSISLSHDAYLTVFEPSSASAPNDPEAERKEARRNRAAELVDLVAEAHREWMMRDLMDPDRATATKWLCVSNMFGIAEAGSGLWRGQYARYADELAEQAGQEAAGLCSGRVAGILAAYVMANHSGDVEPRDAALMGPGPFGGTGMERLDGAIDDLSALLAAMQQDGYERSANDDELLDLMEEALTEMKKEE